MTATSDQADGVVGCVNQHMESGFEILMSWCLGGGSSFLAKSLRLVIPVGIVEGGVCIVRSLCFLMDSVVQTCVMQSWMTCNIPPFNIMTLNNNIRSSSTSI